MKPVLLIFILAFLIRFINLLFLDLNVDDYIIEDQKFYWEWSLKSAYLPWSELSAEFLSERMPGSFWFFAFLQWLTNENLFLILIIQSLIDCCTCVLIFKCAGLINKKYELYAGIFAAFSPLMIVTSSQILSDTIFLFIFSCSLYFILRFIYVKNSLTILFLCALCLGLSAFIRAANFPIIFLSLPIIFFIIRANNFSNKKIIFSISLFFLIAILPVSNRWFNNIIYNETFSLTSQAGSHIAYWMIPGVLSVSNDMDRGSSLNYINSRIKNEGGLTGKKYLDSKIMTRVSKDIIFEQSLFNLSYAWFKSSALNIITSNILLDLRVRNLAHPSFSEAKNIKEWLKSLLLEKENLLYGKVLLITSVISIFSVLSFIIGFYYLVRENIIMSIISFFIIIYFSLITGPIISPKYCLPFIPIIIYFQSITLKKLFNFVYKRYYGDNN